jgi:ABC-type sugar transport system ATPase subunit
LLERLPQHLSGGQKQRVSLARALVRRPAVYLLDEPIAHLDARLKFSTQTLLKEFATRFRSTIIYVTHDYKEALALSDRIAVLRKGSIEQEGTPYEIYNTPGTDFVGNLVGEPPMNLMDGEIVMQDGKTLFKVGEEFIVPISETLSESVRKVATQENGRTLARLGIRCEHIRLSREKVSNRSLQLPVYAIVHETGSSIVTFEVKGKFLYVRTAEERNLCDYCVSEKVWLDFDQDRLFFYPKTFEISKA